jgi:hypothetical protein
MKVLGPARGALLAVLITLSPGAVSAQPARGAAPLREPHDGDCSLVLELPGQIDAAGLQAWLNGQPLTISVLQTSPIVVALRDPLRQGDDVRVTVGGHEYRQLVAARPAGASSGMCDPTAPKPQPTDARGVFEASAYVGTAFDNFAPNIVGDYKNPGAGSQIKSRWVAGVEAQYRIWGSASTNYQVWISSKTLHGVRTADINCNETPSVAVCSKTATTSDKFLYILEHASTMEAHVDPRFEFLTLQPLSEVPTKVFVVARFGFLNLEGAPRVFNSDSIGLGFLAPSGVFKGSSAQVAWGRSEQFQSNADWNRLKINGLLAFDLMPSLRDQLQFWKRLGGSTRMFVEISIDRNPNGPGPDSVQTYVGIDFDLRRAFSSFAP